MGPGQPVPDEPQHPALGLTGYFEPARASFFFPFLEETGPASAIPSASIPTAGCIHGGRARPQGEFNSFLELAHLKVFVPRPEYLLAMKCAAMRLGEEFHDLDDVRYLLRYLNVTKVEEALGIVTRYFDEGQLLPKTRLDLEELLPGRTAS